MKASPPLTYAEAFGQAGVHNPVTFQVRLGHEIARCQRYRIPFSLLLIQLDGIEEAPNPALSAELQAVQEKVTEILGSTARTTDFIGIEGHRRLSLGTPHTSLDSAEALADRIRENLALSRVELPGSPENLLTCSIGVAQYHSNLGNILAEAAELFTQSETALSAAISQGGNRYTSWSQSPNRIEENLILVVAIDDSPEDLERLRLYMDEIPEWTIGYLPFQDVESARTQIAYTQPDLIFLNQDIGNFRGANVLTQMRESGVSCPVILTTTVRGEEVALEALRSGASDYLPKDSLSPKSLRRSMANCLEKHRLRREIEKHRTKLEKTNRDLLKRTDEIQSFYHTLSHELKTPLTASLEFLAIVLDGLAGPLTDDQREYLAIAKESCSQIWAHVNDLLDVTRLETGKLTVERKAASLEEVLRKSHFTLLPRAQEGRIALSLEVAGDLPDVFIDERRVTQVVTNLVTNALKFTPEGGNIAITASRSQTNPGWVEVSVTDTGRGIEKEHLDRIFERLYQTRESDTAVEGGLGLGLHLCRQVVRLHGGRIGVESAPGRGSKFTFTVPLFNRAVGPHVLVVDDEPGIVEVASEALRREGYEIATAGNGVEAIERIRERIPDVILLDLKMPVMNGPEALREIEKEWGNIPVLILTGYPDSDLVPDILDGHSPATLIAKPFYTDQLLSGVRDLLSARRANPSAEAA